MSTPDDHPAPRGYAAAFDTYWQASWRGILPLPAGTKTPPPTGWTGRGAPWPSYPDLYTWAQDHDGANLALRLPEDVIGLDVDSYGGKPGAATLAQLSLRCGRLPDTWRTTSRDDGVSGIRLFRAPTGLAWPGVAGPGIEIIQSVHRYAIAWPSTHPDTGRAYRWIGPDGAPLIASVPTPDDLPHLPEAWVDHLTARREDDGQPHPQADDAAARAWLGALPDDAPCQVVTHATTKRCVELAAPGAASRHDVVRGAVLRVVMLAVEGHPGAPRALATLREAFLRAVSGDRGQREAGGEWDRVLAGATRRAATLTRADVDPCTDPFHGLVTKEQPWPTTTSAPPPTSNNPTTTPPTPRGDPTSAPTGEPNEPPPGEASAPTAEPTSSTSDDQLVYGLDPATYAAAVAQEALKLHISADARALHIAQRTPPAPPFDAGLLADILARPEEPAYRVDGLIPADASTLVVAQRKTGKTTLTLNLARALLLGTDFLGRFPVRGIDGRVALLNYEVSGATAARWAYEHGVPVDRLYLVNLRGRRNPLAHPDDQAALAEQLRAHDVETLICDPFGRAYTGASQNDAGEVQQFLVNLDTFTREQCGAKDLVLTAHAGWNGERTRGSSALEDWADTLVYLSSDNAEEDDDDAPRSTYLRATGRDVDVEEDLLHFDELTRTLSLTGSGNRRAARTTRRLASIKTAVLIFVQENPGCSGHDIEAGVEGRRDSIRDARRSLLTDRVIAERPRQGRGGGVSYWPVEPVDETSPNLAQPRPGEVPNLARPPYRGGGVRVEVREEDPSAPSACLRCGQRLSLARQTSRATLCPGCDR